VNDSPSDHWSGVYRRRDAQQVSWYRAHLETSLRLLRKHGLTASSRVIDVGGGASTLVDDLLASGLERVTVLDLADDALAVARARLGPNAGRVDWIVGDVTAVPLPSAAFDFWHDRAVLHFLTEDRAARAYASAASRTVKPGGIAVVSGFAPEGPTKCSGLVVARRSSEDIAEVLGASFELIDQATESHRTPAGNEQPFVYAVLRRREVRG
jgi:SAM-dependent methyltransferase